MEMSHIQAAGLSLLHSSTPSQTPPTPLPPPLWSDIDYTILVLINQNFLQLPVMVVCSGQLCMYDDLHTLVATGGIRVSIHVHIASLSPRPKTNLTAGSFHTLQGMTLVHSLREEQWDLMNYCFLTTHRRQCKQFW